MFRRISRMLSIMKLPPIFILALQNQPEAPVTAGGLLSQFENSLGSGNILTSAVTGGLVGSLASKFGLPPLITGAIAASLPGLMEKYVQKHVPPAETVNPVTT